jgi:hypothetical protein
MYRARHRRARYAFGVFKAMVLGRGRQHNLAIIHLGSYDGCQIIGVRGILESLRKR